MKKILLLIILIIILSGCSMVNSHEDKNISTNIDKINLESYSGKWYSSDYTKEKDNLGNYVQYGSEMVLDIEERHIEILTISKPPASRIAYINSEIELVDDVKGIFTFDDDGWGNKGKGSILFEKNKIIVEIDIEQFSNDNWRIFIGQKTFFKIP